MAQPTIFDNRCRACGGWAHTPADGLSGFASEHQDCADAVTEFRIEVPLSMVADGTRWSEPVWSAQVRSEGFRPLIETPVDVESTTERTATVVGWVVPGDWRTA